MTFEWKEKAVNGFYIDQEYVEGKGKYFRSRFLQPGLVKYSFGVCLLEKEVIDSFIQNFVGCPVIIDHKDVTEESAKDDRVGVISKVWFDEFDGWYWGEGVIFDKQALELIEKGYNVSCQYEITEYSDNNGKLHNGNEFDKTILAGKPEHLAIVENPRYENAMIAVNALDKTEIDKNIFVKAINEIKETNMFKNLFKKEKTMDKEELKSIMMECLTELTAKNAEDEKAKEAENEAEEEKKAENEEDKKEDEKAENECDYKKMYEELKAKVDTEAANKCKNEDDELKEKEEEEKEKEAENKAKNAIEEQKGLFTANLEASNTSTYISQAKAVELGDKLF